MMAVPNAETTRVARLTPLMPAAIATLAIEGPAAVDVVSTFFRDARRRRVTIDVGQVRFGLWLSATEAMPTGTASEMPAEHVVACRLTDDRFEIHCHGGIAVSDLLVRDMVACGGTLIGAAEWPSQHAGRLEAEAELALCRAPTLKLSTLLLDQMQGNLRRELRAIMQAIDNGQLLMAIEGCERLLRWPRLSEKLTAPWTLTLAGPPNVGKSSLTNALIGAARVLVHDEPGTTRDAVDASIVIASWPVTITDTAGMRTTAETVEKLGIEAARVRWQQADIGLLVVDAVVGWTATHDELLAARSLPTLVIFNKSDLQPASRLPDGVEPRVSGIDSPAGKARVVHCSATASSGIAGLLQVLGDHFDHDLPPPGSGVLFSRDQHQSIKQVLAHLTTHQPERARRELENILE